MDDEWREIEKGYVEACGEMLGKAKSTKKEWISKETWKIIERRQVAKNAVNMAKTRNQKRAASESYQYLGSIVSKKGGTEEDIQARIGKARQVFAMLRPIWRSTSLATGLS